MTKAALIRRVQAAVAEVRRLDQLPYLDADYDDERAGREIAVLCRDVVDAARLEGYVLDYADPEFLDKDSALSLLGEILARSRGPKAEALLIGISEVARLLAVSTRTIKRRMKERGVSALPQPVRLGRSVRWVRSELEAWVLGGGK